MKFSLLVGSDQGLFDPDQARRHKVPEGSVKGQRFQALSQTKVKTEVMDLIPTQP